jgi:hypothetical protein
MLKYHIQTIELLATGGAASINFNSVPQIYDDLYLVWSTRYVPSSGMTKTKIIFNGSSSNFSYLLLQGNGATTASGANTINLGGMNNGSDTTANTFSSNQMYISDYTSNLNKNYSVDAVSENNATTAYQDIWSGLWSNSAPITNIALSGDVNFAQYSSASLYGIKRGSDGQTISFPFIEGGTVTTSGAYTYHTFRSSGTLKVNRSTSVETLLVAGGGSSGTSYSGGGGAGGVLQSSGTLAVGEYSAVVGAGGAGSNGSDSSISSFVAIGGGRGADGGRNNGFAGGSGGGGGGVTSSPNTLGGAGTAGQGNNGGQGTVGISSYELSGGGGGAGAVGGNATTSVSGNGGVGTNTYSAWASATSSGASGYYAGGGAGGHWYRTSGSAGIGGGGAVDTAGTVNTGGGGGGRYLGGAGFAGGSGIVIIRYLTP